MFDIKFNENRKRITLLSLIICWVCSRKERVINAKILNHIRILINNGVSENEEYQIDDMNYRCLKNSKNLVIKVTFSKTQKVLILKFYAYTSSWLNEGFLLRMLLRKDFLNDFPIVQECGYLKNDNSKYRKILLYNVFPYYEGNTFSMQEMSLDEERTFFKDLGLYYWKMEESLNSKIHIRLYNSMKKYHFGENMYNLRFAQQYDIPALQKDIVCILDKYNLSNTIIIQNDIYEYNVLINPMTNKISEIIDYEFLSQGNKMVTLYYLMNDFFEDESRKIKKDCVVAFCEGYKIPLEALEEIEVIFEKWKNVFDTCISDLSNPQCDNNYYFFAEK